MSRRTDTEVMDLLRGDSALNKARQIFSSESARIEQAGQQRQALSPIEMRRMEFEAVEKIIAALPPPQVDSATSKTKLPEVDMTPLRAAKRASDARLLKSTRGPQEDSGREEIARIIDPDAQWGVLLETGSDANNQILLALEKADAILALRPERSGDRDAS